MRICICDDDLFELEKTSNMMQNLCIKMNLNCVIDKFNDANVLLNKLTYFNEETQYDIYLLDIIMQVEGIEIAKKIREFDQHCLIIFITSSKDFAIDAFGVRALNYLLKPIEADEFNNKMTEAFKNLENKPKTSFIFKATNHSVVSINIENVVYIESLNRRMVIHLDSMEEISSPILRTKFQEAIPFDYRSHNFLPCHSSYIVNLNQIKALEKGYFITKTEEAVPISKQFYPDVKKRYIDYLLGEQ